MTFDSFFQTATGNKPYDYQRRLAGGDAGRGCDSLLIDIPTGLGKTAAVVLAWLWNRVGHPDRAHRDTWPRRLVICLPMRTLVEQTRDNVRLWLRNLGDLEWSPKSDHVGKVGLHLLMGGEEAGEWDLYPEADAILIGTQDMLLSRALNRGYGAARARWPMHFGLLNNDCLWVLDETQLMGAGLWTSAQLDWLRQDRFKPAKDCVSWWMSATVGSTFLETKDRKDAKLLPPTKIDIPPTEARKIDLLKAIRPLSSWQPSSAKDRKDRSAFIGALAAAVFAEHKEHTLSLVVCNTVATAQEAFAAIKSANNSRTEITLLTSRFRRADRKVHLDKLLAFENARKAAIKSGNAVPEHLGLICVSTQVIEAGVDISARRLWTEHAPWPPTLQRLGRLNRDGRYDTKDNDGNLRTDARALVFETPSDKNIIGPYEPEELKASKKIVDAIIKSSLAEPQKPIREIIATIDVGNTLESKSAPFPRAFEVHGLFSTEPDLFGGFTDVSPWVRGGDRNADVTIFWRNWDTAKKSPNAIEYAGPSFRQDEGCTVAVYRVRDFVNSSKNAFIWNDRVGRWEPIKPRDICPGMVLMLPTRSGGYDAEKGWTGQKADKPTNTPPPGRFDAESEDDDKQTTTKQQWVPLDTHLTAVASEAETISGRLGLPSMQKMALVRAAALHDIGKSIPQWQNALPTPRPNATRLWAKAPSFFKRCGMRHEAASALAAWRRYYRDHDADFPALTIYLIAAHHGLVRTVLNSRAAPAQQPNVAGIPLTEPPPALPWHEKPGDNWQLDFTPTTDGVTGEFYEDAKGELLFAPATPGWSALVADLLGSWEANAPQFSAGAVPADEPHSLNPFHLAFLEALLRAADCRISASETGISNTEPANQ